MGMKKGYLGGILAIAMAMEAMSATDFPITERGNLGTGREPKLSKPRKHTPFKENEGVLKMIEDYNLIRRGESKKGIFKQKRIKDKIDEWLKSGMLNEDDLTVSS